MIEGLSTLLSYFQSERHNKTARGQDALEKLHKAVHETHKYLSSKTNNPEQEMELSNLWGLAAIAARNISKDLARRCYIKSGYWKDPDSWSFEKIKGSRISLKEIEFELAELINK
jgi:hypothetical protein